VSFNTVQALINETACVHKPRAEKGACARPRPGATQGGCCFDGARNTLLPIADAVHIVHGPISCAGSSWDNRGSRSSGPDTYRIGMTTDMSDMDVIMGRGEAKLAAAIKHAIETYRPPAVFIYATCVPAMQGDDLEKIARNAEAEFGVPVIAVDAAGFYGNKNLGNKIAGDTIFKRVIGTAEPDPVTNAPDGMTVHDVNLIGEWNVGGEFWNVAPLFDELGLRVLCTFSGDARFREVRTMHRAQADMVVCSKAMIHVARKMEETWGIPFFEGSFYGVADTSAALRGFARLLNDADLTRRTEALIAREEAVVEAALVDVRTRLKGKRALVFSGGYKSWSIVSALRDLGLEVTATGTEKSTEEDKARIRDLMGPGALMISNNDQTALISSFRSLHADVLIAGDRYIYPTLKSRIPFLDVDHVRRVGYAGYRGAIEFARDLDRAIRCPVWATVAEPAPWDGR